MTRAPGRPLPGSPDPGGHRQKIEAIEETISTTMPGQIVLGSLKLFEAEIIAAIAYLRQQSAKCKNKGFVIAHLEEAKIPLQLAIDEAHPGGNSRRRYQNISSVGRKLREALSKW